MALWMATLALVGALAEVDSNAAWKRVHAHNE
jgi:hypothetical protein